MSSARLVVAALGGMVTYFVFGFLVFAILPAITNEFRKYPALYRTQEQMKSVMPIGMVAIFFSTLVLAAIYAMAYRGGSGVAEGARFGALIGVFAVCAFVLHNYVNLNIGLKLTIEQAVAYFVQWTLVGIVIGLMHRPA